MSVMGMGNGQEESRAEAYRLPGELLANVLGRPWARPTSVERVEAWVEVNRPAEKEAD